MIFLQHKETSTLIKTIVDVQPRSGSTGGGDTPDQIVWRICEQTRAAVVQSVDRTKAHPDLLTPDDAGQLHSLTTVLLHETDRFNTLLALIHASLNELQKAIKVSCEKLQGIGLIVECSTNIGQLLQNRSPQIGIPPK